MNDTTNCSENANDYFGVCPECGSHDGYLNVGRDHWFKCDTHKTKWNFGSNIFSDWRRESDQQHQRNREVLNTYRTVKPARALVDDDRKHKIEADVVIATYGNQKWAVVSLSGVRRDVDMPSVIYSGFETFEAAQSARHEVIGQCVDHGAP